MTLHIVQGKDGLDRRAFSVADLGRMVDAGIMDAKEPVELREGELIAVPAEKFAHSKACFILARRLHRALGDEWVVCQETTLQLGANTLVEPDFFACLRTFVRPSAEGFLIVPPTELFVIEVADSSLLRDRRMKADLYARHGVREYWIVDLNGQQIIMHRRPAAAGYETVNSISGGDVATPEAPGPIAFRLGIGDLD